ncbi:lysylphosphatidylglycerol synthase domain-containing protein [Paraburkholderia unamae]|uniref:Membrane protein n=1 Tax=Paraburkholderia unamae TaxID=219649 RepID=A0ABX5K6K7_9BURK|nr:lysylphosphatidylglycerol synthase domain-containing protein [Paraburkholderia unamae]PVX61159.1 putative membrane protein [Paraburkholderia unamae]RAR48645.1 putative membrane protein [Paraburkholderia unamae]CAG9253466.1 Putative membrane protein [Paraburkholderia unamae]
MKHMGRIAALCGFAIAVWLVWRDHPAAVLQLLRGAGMGLVLAASAHILPMCANAWDWRSLIRPAQRPTFATMLKLVWIRESINGLLPVARIGGEIVSFRLMGRAGVRPATAVASLVVDTQLTLISQLVFALVAAGYLLEHSSSDTARFVGRLAWAIAALAPVLVLFALVQHARPFERAARTLNHLTSGKVVDLVGKSARVDQSVKLIWRQTGVVVRYLLIWQTLQCLGYALEIWIALRVLGTDATFMDAFVIEALIQMLSSIAFLIPANLGVQEGGFVLLGGLLGFDAPTCLALAGARRVRDLLFYLPGLLAWQAAEYGWPSKGRAGGVQ